MFKLLVFVLVGIVASYPMIELDIDLHSNNVTIPASKYQNGTHGNSTTTMAHNHTVAAFKNRTFHNIS